MALAENRTLSIQAKLLDYFSGPMSKIGATIGKFASSSITHFRGMAQQIFSVRSAMATLAGGFVAFRGSEVVTGIVQATDELDKLARGTGSTVQRLLTLKNAFFLQGIEADRFKTTLGALTKSISSALTDSSGKAAKALGRLGLSLEDVKSNDPVQVLDRMSKALERFATPQEKAAALLEVFPKMTSEISVLVDTLGQGQQAFRNLVATAEFFGGTMSDKAVAAVVRFDQALDVMRLSLDRVGRSATVAIAERMAPLVERLATFMAQNGDRIGQELGRVLAAISELILKLSAAFLRLVAFLTSNGEKIVEALEGLPIVGKQAAEALREIFDTRTIAPGARAYRDQLAQMADQIETFVRQTREGQQELRQMQANPAEFGQDRISAQMRKLEDLEQRRRDLVLAMVGIQDQFNAAQEAGGGLAQFDEISRQENAAKIRSFAAEISQLFNFDNLPAPPTDLSPIIKATFGAGGIPEATAKVRSFFQGFDEGFAKVKEKWGDFGAAGEEAATRLVDGGLNGITEAFADIVTRTHSAKEAFRDLATSWLHDLAQIIGKLTLMRWLMGLGLNIGGVAAATTNAAASSAGWTPASSGFGSPLGVRLDPGDRGLGAGQGAGTGRTFVPRGSSGQGGGGITVNITAMDSKDVARALLENRGTLRQILTNQLGRHQDVRQAVGAI